MGLFKKQANPLPKLENISIQRYIPKCKDWKIDTISINTRTTCSSCKQYNNKIYSLHGWNKKYPKLPVFLYNNRCPDCNVSISACMYFPGISSEPKK